MSSEPRLYQILETLTLEFNALTSEPDRRESLDKYKLQIQQAIDEGEDPTRPQFLGCIPLMHAVSIQSNEAFADILNILHPMGVGPDINGYDPSSLSATPVIYSLLKNQQFIKAKMLFDRGASLAFCHPILSSTPLHFLCTSLARNESESEAQVSMLQEALKNSALPWNQFGKISTDANFCGSYKERIHLSFIHSPLQLLITNDSLKDRLKLSHSEMEILHKKSPSSLASIEDLTTLGSEAPSQLAKDYLNLSHHRARHPFIKTLAFEPSDLLISLMLDRIISCHHPLSEGEDTYSHFAAESNDIETLKRLLSLGFLSPNPNKSGKSIFDYPALRTFPTDDFMLNFFMLKEIPAEASSSKIPSKLTQLLSLWLKCEHEHLPFHPTAITDWVGFFLSAEISARRHPLLTSTTFYERIQDSFGRTPLEIASYLSDIPVELYTLLTCSEVALLKNNQKPRLLPNALQIAIQELSFPKISTLVQSQFHFFNILPIRGGNALLELCNRINGVFDQPEKYSEETRKKLIPSLIFFVLNIINEYQTLFRNVLYLSVDSSRNSLLAFSMNSVVQKLCLHFENFISNYPRPSEASSQIRGLISESREKIAAVRSLLSFDSLREFEILDFDIAYKKLSLPCLWVHLIEHSTYDGELPRLVRQLKEKIIKEIGSLEESDYEKSLPIPSCKKLLSLFIQRVDDKVLQLEDQKRALQDFADRERDAEQKAQELLDELLAEETAAKAKKEKPKKGKKKKPKKAILTNASTGSASSTSAEKSESPKPAFTEPEPIPATPPYPSKEEMIEVHCSDGEEHKRLALPVEPSKKLKKPKIKLPDRADMPDYFRPYEPHYQMIFKVLSRYFSPTELAERLWVYGSVLDGETHSTPADIDFVLYLSAELSESQMSKISTLLREQLIQAHLEATPDQINVTFHPPFRSWTLESPRICIDLRLKASPIPVRDLIQEETKAELILHKAKRFNPHTGQTLGSTKQNFELSRNPYNPKNSLEVATLAYLIKNLALTQRKLDKKTAKIRDFMHSCISLKNPETFDQWYGLHFIALNLTILKYRKHLDALLNYYQTHQFIPLLLGIEGKAEVNIKETLHSPNPFFSACLAYRGHYTPVDIEKIKTHRQLGTRKNQELLTRLLEE